MRVRVTVFALLAVAAAAVFSLNMMTVLGQVPAGMGQIPRTPDGKPDMSGVWQVLDNSLNENIEPHAASWGVRAGQGGIVDPPDGMIPYLPEARARREENYKNRARDPVAHCYKPGVPRITYIPYPFQITQTPTWMVFTYEFVHNYRNIYLNGSDHLEGIDFFNGDSRARWDGDTLVVDVTNFNDEPDLPTWFDGSGNYHSNALHVVERYQMTSPITMTYRATIEDPKVFSRPWTIQTVLYKHVAPNFRLMEYECQWYKETIVRQGKGPYIKIVED